METLFVLIHSPLCGPLTWSPVVGELHRRGIEAIVPALRGDEGRADPLWRQEAESVAAALAAVPAARRVARRAVRVHAVHHIVSRIGGASPAGGVAPRAFDAGHFHMLVDPVAVADALVDLRGEVLGVR